LKRKLILLNLVLLALIAAAGGRLRQVWLEAQARERALATQRIATAPVPQPPPAAPPAAVTSATYLEVAQKMLFARDRNSQVIVEVTPVAEKPLPPLPAVHGVMNIGNGPTLIMSEPGSTRQRGVTLGEQIGEFKVAALEGDTLTLAWEDRLVKRRLDELAPREPAPQAESLRPQAQRGEPAPTAPPKQAPAAPGAQTGPEMRACQPGDSSAPGTVAEGYRKVTTQTPFGSACRWELIK